MRFSLIIPAYNEEQNIAKVLERSMQAVAQIKNLSGMLDAEIIVVDDGSTDQTAAMVRRYPTVRLITHECNRGYGAALKTGFSESKGDIVAFLDADGTYPPEHLASLCQPVIEHRADVTIASRNMGMQSGMPVARRIGNWCFARALAWVSETHVDDSASGMRVFRKSILPRLLPLPDGLDFIIGLSTRVLHEDLKVQEIPIPYAERGGQSKLHMIEDGFRFIRTLVTVAVTYNPLKFFGFMGLLLLAVTGYMGIGPLSYYLQFRRVEDWEIYRLFTILVLGVVGLQLISFGIMGNRLVALVSGHPVGTRSFLGRLFLNPRFPRISRRAGVALCVGAVLLNFRTIAQYLALRSISVHWSYIFTGATMFVVGSQLLMTGCLLAVFQKIEERQAYLKHLTCE